MKIIASLAVGVVLLVMMFVLTKPDKPRRHTLTSNDATVRQQVSGVAKAKQPANSAQSSSSFRTVKPGASDIMDMKAYRKEIDQFYKDYTAALKVHGKEKKRLRKKLRRRSGR